MDLLISLVEQDDEHALTGLYRWLSRDAAMIRTGRVRLEKITQTPGEMGGAFDVINAVFADAGAAAGIGSLLVAYRTWRDTRSKPPSLRIEKDGVSIIVSEGSEQEIPQILAVLLPDNLSEPKAQLSEENLGEN